MKVALVHDWLNTKAGGAENVLFRLAELFPDAPVYTLLHNPATTEGKLDAARVRTSSLQRMPSWLRGRPRYLLPLIPTAVEQLDFTGYDVVVSSSSAWVKGIITRPETLHICYCHTPMRFVWDYWPRYADEQHVGPLRRAAIHRLTSRSRLWDYYSAARVDHWVANSQTTAARIRKYYHQPVDKVIYPGADLSLFAPADNPPRDYYVTLGSLTPYKKIDMAIEACNQLQAPLTVVGDGADRARLEKLAGPTVTFAGRVNEARRRELVAGAKALVFPNEEDFGIVPVEAMASGTPVIAFGRGGLTETVVEGETGSFFHQPTAAALAAAMKNFDPGKFQVPVLTKRAAEFSEELFMKQFKEYVEKAYGQFRP